MGSSESKFKNKTDEFFDYNFGKDNRFEYDLESGEKIIFTYIKNTDKGYLVDAEFLTRPHKTSSVMFQDVKSCACKSDLATGEPAFTFEVRHQEAGFFKKRFTTRDPYIKEIMLDLERELFED